MLNVKGIVFILFLIMVSAIEARMYQWTEPDTSTTQLSGKPPAWYRSVDGGPRVFVFDNGRLIDDTNVKVSEEVRQRMRQKAFILVEEDKQRAKEKITKARQLKQKYEQEKPKKTEQENLEELIESEKEIIDEIEPSQLEKQDSDKEPALDALRQLIDQWEKNQTESAKKILE